MKCVVERERNREKKQRNNGNFLAVGVEFCSQKCNILTYYYKAQIYGEKCNIYVCCEFDIIIFHISCDAHHILNYFYYSLHKN